MELILPTEIARKLKDALIDAGSNEIGGILMGERIDDNRFRIKDITIQSHGGSFAMFLRAVHEVVGPLRKFFRTTNHNYTRFNYIGEWHSHPSFSLNPSMKDVTTMRDIIDDPKVGANFVALMIVRLSYSNDLEGSVTVYQPGGRKFIGRLVRE